MHEEEFLSATTMCRILPGANQVNMAVFIGTKFHNILLSIGGGNSVLPEMHRQSVGTYHWLTDNQFAEPKTPSLDQRLS
jgi:chromate transport protein ChrA